MARRLLLGVLVVATTLAGTTACGGGGEENAEREGADRQTATRESVEPVTVELTEVNRSGRSGTATLSEGQGGSIDVVVEMNDQRGGVPVIHGFVYCSVLAENPERGVEYALNPLKDGRSETTVDMGVEEGKALLRVAIGSTFFAVHASSPEDRVVACGEIPRL